MIWRSVKDLGLLWRSCLIELVVMLHSLVGVRVLCGPVACWQFSAMPEAHRMRMRRAEKDLASLSTCWGSDGDLDLDLDLDFDLCPDVRAVQAAVCR